MKRTAYLAIILPLLAATVGLLGPEPADAQAPLATLNGWASWDRFGYSFASLGDIDHDHVDDFIVGAVQYYTTNGHAVVYSGRALTTIRVHYGQQAACLFGHAMAEVGDQDRDGVTDYAICAVNQDLGGVGNVGLVYLYSGASGALLATIAGTHRGEKLGMSIAGAGGDIDGDGRPELVIGAADHHGTWATPGYAQVYRYSGSALVALSGYRFSGASSSWDRFNRVARLGDVTGDGKPEIAVGGPQYRADGAPTGPGYVKIFDGANPARVVWQRTGLAHGDRFGIKVAGAGGDLDGDGKPDLLVGAPQWSGGVSPLGSGYVVVLSGGSGSLHRTWSGNRTGDAFGWSVAGIPDIDRDGVRDVIAGAPQNVVGPAPNPGPHYGPGYVSVYSARLGSLYRSIPGTITNGIFGHAVSATGDLNGDGLSEVIVGAIAVNNATGQAQVFTLNRAPIADAGANQVKDEGASVVLDGTASSDPDHDAVTYDWTQVAGPPVTLSDSTAAQPGFTAPLLLGGDATLRFRLLVFDGMLFSDPAFTEVRVRNVNDPPVTAGAFASPGLLWPPNHKLIEVRIRGVTDPDDDPVTLTMSAVTQDEPVNGLGDGDTAPDAVIENGRLYLRAERAGNGNGRVYRVSFLADDGKGGQSTGFVVVQVPKSRKAASAIDDGQSYNSLGP